MRSKFLIVKISDLKMRMGSKIKVRKSAKTKMGPEPPAKVANLRKRKRVECAVDMGQGDENSQGTAKMTDKAMGPPILIS